jgi:hypothetical protein
VCHKLNPEKFAIKNTKAILEQSNQRAVQKNCNTPRSPIRSPGQAGGEDANYKKQFSSAAANGKMTSSSSNANIIIQRINLYFLNITQTGLTAAPIPIAK